MRRQTIRSPMASAHGTYEVVSGRPTDEDMAVEIDGERFLVILDGDEDERAVFRLSASGEVEMEPVGRWDGRRQLICLDPDRWYEPEDDHSSVSSDGSEGGFSVADSLSRADDQLARTRQQLARHRPSPAAAAPRTRKRTAAAAAQRGYEARLHSARYDPEPELMPPQKRPPRTEQKAVSGVSHTAECFDLVFDLGAQQMDDYAGHHREADHRGIVWGVHKRSGRIYVQEVLRSFEFESTPANGAPPARGAPHELQGCYLLQINGKSARRMHPDMVEARLDGAQDTDTRTGGLELTFQSEPKFPGTPQQPAGGHRRAVREERPGVPALPKPRHRYRRRDGGRCGCGGQPSGLDDDTYRDPSGRPATMSESTFLALRRCRLTAAPGPGRAQPPQGQPEERTWAWAALKLGSDFEGKRDLIEKADKTDRYTHAGRDGELCAPHTPSAPSAACRLTLGLACYRQYHGSMATRCGFIPRCGT